MNVKRTALFTRNVKRTVFYLRNVKRTDLFTRNVNNALNTSALSKRFL